MLRTVFPEANTDQPDGMIHGVCAAMAVINIDTDAIYPKQFLKTVKRTGLENALFADQRFGLDGRPRPEFVLNRPGFCETKILIGGDNFGCGSSREHAVWALKDFGIRALVSSQFGSIFHSNCIKNGLWPLTVSERDLSTLIGRYRSDTPRKITIDTGALQIFPGDGTTIRASLPQSDQAQLEAGLDEIGVTLQMANHIDSFEADHMQRFPWLGGVPLSVTK